MNKTENGEQYAVVNGSGTKNNRLGFKYFCNEPVVVTFAQIIHLNCGNRINQFRVSVLVSSANKILIFIASLILILLVFYKYQACSHLVAHRL